MRRNKFTKRNFTLIRRLFFSRFHHNIDQLFLTFNSLCLGEFWNKTFSFFNYLSYSCLDFVTTDKMVNDSKLFLFTYNLFNRHLSSSKCAKRDLAFRLWLFLSSRYHTSDHFLLTVDSFHFGEFWNKLNSFLIRLSDRSLDLVTANKMGDNNKTLLFIRSLLNYLLRGHEFTEWDLTFCLWLFLSDLNHTLDHFFLTCDCLCLS